MADGERRAAHAPPGFAAQVLAIAGKDLRIEWRSREILFTMGFLAVLVVLVFAFAFMGGADLGLDERTRAAAAEGRILIEISFGPSVVAGLLWVSVLFSGTVALGRTFDREREGEAIRSLLLSPVPRPAIYLGKLIAVVALMLLVEALVVPLCGLLFSTNLTAHLGWLCLLLLLGTIGFAAVGVTFSAALLRAKSRDVLLSALLFPIVIPVFLSGARAASALLDPATPNLGGVLFWLQFLAVCDVLYVMVGLWAFEPIVSGD